MKVLKYLFNYIIIISKKQEKFSVVIIHVGVNDIGHNVSAEDYIINMSKIITELTTKLPNCKIMVDSIYPTVTLNNYHDLYSHLCV